MCVLLPSHEQPDPQIIEVFSSGSGTFTLSILIPVHYSLLCSASPPFSTSLLLLLLLRPYVLRSVLWRLAHAFHQPGTCQAHARKLLGFLWNFTLFWNNPQDVLCASAPGLSALPPVAVSVGPWHQRLGDGQKRSGGGRRGLKLKESICALFYLLFLSCFVPDCFSFVL